MRAGEERKDQGTTSGKHKAELQKLPLTNPLGATIRSLMVNTKKYLDIVR